MTTTIAIMSDADSARGRDALVGAMIAGIFGLAWTQWGASGLSGPISVAVRIVGIVIGLVIVFRSARQRRSAARAPDSGSDAPDSGGSGSMFASPAYRIAVALELVALFGGSAILGVTGHGEYVVAWVATVVGVHFLAFGGCFGQASTGWGRL